MKAPYLTVSLLTAGLILGGCGSDSDAISTARYQVTITNLTHAQPMSPMAVLTHQKSYRLFGIGTTATIALEALAEGGDNASLLDDAHVDAAVSGSDLILPGASSTTTLTSNLSECLSVASMLVNTNDAFAGADCIDIHDLKVGSTLQMDLLAYDAGTEGNSERAATIPGPAGGGVGYDEARDDIDIITVHGGIVGSDDGLSGSALNMSHRWDNPVASIRIERVE